ELLLGSGTVLVDCEGASQDAIERGVVPFVEEMAGPIAIASRAPLGGLRRATTRLDVERPPPAEQRALWRAALGLTADKLNGHFDHLVAQFGFDPAALETATALVDDQGDVEATTARLREACRLHARGRLDGLAQRVHAVAGWDDLVLPVQQRDLLG